MSMQNVVHWVLKGLRHMTIVNLAGGLVTATMAMALSGPFDFASPVGK